MMNSEELENYMRNFYGTENYYHSELLPFYYTDGVKAFCTNAEAYWFLQEVAAIVGKLRDFTGINLVVKDGKADIVKVNSKKTIIKHIPYTDCPEGEWKFYYSPDDKVLIWYMEY